NENWHGDDTNVIEGNDMCITLADGGHPPLYVYRRNGLIVTGESAQSRDVFARTVRPVGHDAKSGTLAWSRKYQLARLCLQARQVHRRCRIVLGALSNPLGQQAVLPATFLKSLASLVRYRERWLFQNETGDNIRAVDAQAFACGQGGVIGCEVVAE